MVYFYAVPIVTNEIHEVKGIDQHYNPSQKGPKTNPIVPQ